jgi:hypothetical protein
MLARTDPEPYSTGSKRKKKTWNKAQKVLSLILKNLTYVSQTNWKKYATVWLDKIRLNV